MGFKIHSNSRRFAPENKNLMQIDAEHAKFHWLRHSVRHGIRGIHPAQDNVIIPGHLFELLEDGPAALTLVTQVTTGNGNPALLHMAALSEARRA